MAQLALAAAFLIRLVSFLSSGPSKASRLTSNSYELFEIEALKCCSVVFAFFLNMLVTPSNELVAFLSFFCSRSFQNLHYCYQLKDSNTWHHGNLLFTSMAGETQSSEMDSRCGSHQEGLYLASRLVRHLL